MDSNTFWMISGTSKISLNLDPINGQIWTRGPRIYSFYYTKILQKILESIWEHPGKYLWKYGNQKFRKYSKVYGNILENIIFGSLTLDFF